MVINKCVMPRVPSPRECPLGNIDREHALLWSWLNLAKLLIDEVRIGLEDPHTDLVLEELAAQELPDHVHEFLPADWRERGELTGE